MSTDVTAATAREKRLEDLNRDLERIRQRKFGIVYYGLWWGFIICILLLTLGIALFYGLSALDLIPEIVLPTWISTDKLVLAAFLSPLIGPVVAVAVTCIKTLWLKREISKLRSQPVSG